MRCRVRFFELGSGRGLERAQHGFDEAPTGLIAARSSERVLERQLRLIGATEPLENLPA